MVKIVNLIVIVVLCFLVSFTAANTLTISKLSQHHEDNLEFKKYSYAYDCMREAEIEYNRVYAEYVTEVQNYITKVAPTSNLRAYALIELCDKYNVDVKFALAQGEVESHYATTGMGAKIRNVFNVGCDDNKTEAEIEDKYKKTCPNESIEPYLKLITSKYLVDKLEADLLQNYVDVNGNRYASDTLYEEKLRFKYDYITRNTRIDELSEIVRNYAIKCGR